MLFDGDMRASDSDREDVVGLLRDAYVDGRLSLAEIKDRAGAAYSARSWHELRTLVDDLPSRRLVRPVPQRSAAVPRAGLVRPVSQRSAAVPRAGLAPAAGRHAAVRPACARPAHRPGGDADWQRAAAAREVAAADQPALPRAGSATQHAPGEPFALMLVISVAWFAIIAAVCVPAAAAPLIILALSVLFAAGCWSRNRHQPAIPAAARAPVCPARPAPAGRSRSGSS